MSAVNSKSNRTRTIRYSLTIIIVLLLVAPAIVAYVFTNKALYPAWAMGFTDCPESREAGWGPNCGNVRLQNNYIFEELSIPSANGTNVPAWYFPAAANANVDRTQHWSPLNVTSDEALQENAAVLEFYRNLKPGTGPAVRYPNGRYAAFFVHGGGADRRQGYRYVPFFTQRGIDFYVFDMICHGEADCPVQGLSFGQREHRDVLAVYRHLADRYQGIVATGTSVGATALLVALPDMPRVRAVIVENPMIGIGDFVRDTPAAPALFPDWYRKVLLSVLLTRGRFDGLATASNSLGVGLNTPILFIHSQQDSLNPWQHSVTLHDLHAGPAELWLLQSGGHSRLWNANPELFERRMSAFLLTHLR
ncbi:MAG: alpha/beta hydrolase [Leptospiraceae bacterium]|nr:alpha/beta hydrolase [Leptospiraceae bacterium]MCB1314849.1 alpha/beta hydrolase [Leptospiraceae bacterium]